MGKRNASNTIYYSTSQKIHNKMNSVRVQTYSRKVCLLSVQKVNANLQLSIIN